MHLTFLLARHSTKRRRRKHLPETQAALDHYDDGRRTAARAGVRGGVLGHGHQAAAAGAGGAGGRARRVHLRGRLQPGAEDQHRRDRAHCGQTQVSCYVLLIYLFYDRQVA